MNVLAKLVVAAIGALVLSTAPLRAQEEPTGPILEALILAGADHPLVIENEDYLGVLQAQGLSETLPGVLGALFGSLPRTDEDESNPSHATLTHSCDSVGEFEECSLTILYVENFDGDSWESAVILAFSMVDGRLVPSIPVRLMLAG